MMQRYFFNTVDGGRSNDDEGIELASDAAARVHAIRYAGAIMDGNPDVLWDGHEFKVEVTDERNVRLFTVVSYTINEPAP